MQLWLELATALELEGRPDDALALCREVVLASPRASARAREMLTRLTGEHLQASDPARPPGVRASRRATLRGLFSEKNRERAAAVEEAGIVPSTAAADPASSGLLESFDRTEGSALTPRARRPSIVDISLALFPGMPDAALQELSKGVRRRDFESGDVILREGEPGDAFYVIETGPREFLKRDPLDPRGDFIEVTRLYAESCSANLPCSRIAGDTPPWLRWARFRRSRSRDHCFRDCRVNTQK